MTSIAIGNYITLANIYQSNGALYRFQNFFIGENAILDGTVYGFLPFGFTGATASRSGANSDSVLVFPNTQTTRAFADVAIDEGWTAFVNVALINSDSPSVPAQRLYRYIAQVSGGTWATEEIALKLSSVLDAVNAQVPRRSLTQPNVGYLPITGDLSL